MPVAVNHAKRKLADGELVLGFGVRQGRSVEIGLIARAAGYDFLFIDREHGTMELSTAAEISTAALGQGVTPIVRVSGIDEHLVAPLLDAGAQGIAFPHVETAEDAKRIIEMQKFPPLGKRSISRSTPWTGFEPMPIGAFTAEVNANVLTVAMLESPGAIERAEEIAAVAHIDVLLIGTSDLCIEMGIPGEFGHARIGEAYARVVAACRRHGKFAGMSGVRDDALMRLYVESGVRFALVVTDTTLLIEAGAAKSKGLRSLMPRAGG